MLVALAAARQAFPFDFRFRMGEASFYARVRWKGSREAAIAAIEAAMQTDPYAMDLRRNLAGLLYEAGNVDGAVRELMFIKHYMPRRNVPILVNANPATN